MEVSVEVCNLGPLRSAKVDIADLTLLVGKNNTGKTFLATILHRVLKASPYYMSPIPYTQPHTQPLPIPAELEGWIVEQITEPVEKKEIPFSIEDPPREIVEWVNDTIEKSLKELGASILNGIEYAFGVEASKLRRRTPSRHASDCYLLIESKTPNWKLEIRFDKDLITPTLPDANLWLSKLLDEVQDYKNSPRRYTDSGSPRYEDHVSFQTNRIRRKWLFELYRDWPRQAVHLPAGRTGLMQSYYVISDLAIEQASLAGLHRIEIESLPGTSADFLRLLLNQQSRRQSSGQISKKIQSLTKDLEKEIGVTIKVDKRGNSRDMILAVTPEGKFPMSRTSSMLSELATMLLILKGYIQPGDHLTIDEPESHLHPEMQIIIASFLCEILQYGIKILITTHSDFFLSELNNMIRSSSLKTDRKNINVSALQFSRNDRWCESRELEIDPIDGIDDHTFAEVMEAFYDKTTDLINELLKQKI